MNSNNNILGTVGYLILALHYFRNLSMVQQQIIFIGYFFMLSYYLFKLIKVNKQYESGLKISYDIGRLLFIIYYFINIIDNKSYFYIWGLLGNLLYFTEYKKMSNYLLAIHYIVYGIHNTNNPDIMIASGILASIYIN